MPLPDVDVTFDKKFFVNSEDGAGVYFLNTPQLTLGPSVFFRRGRFERDGAVLRGLGEIPLAPELRFGGEWTITPGFSLSAAVAQDVGKNPGTKFELKAMGTIPLSDKLFLLPGVSATPATRTYMQTWHGISAFQSANSGRASYTPHAGLESIGASMNIAYMVTPHWIVFGRTEILRLMQDAAKSPLTERRNQPSFGAGLSYKL